MVHIFAVSLSGRAPATAGFVSFWPIDFTLENYQEVMGSRTFFRSFVISVVLRVLTGTSLNMVLDHSHRLSPCPSRRAHSKRTRDFHLVLPLSPCSSTAA